MKRTTLLAIACACLCGGSALAQEQEVVFVEDAQQGYLMNRFRDNWFITAEGGANVLFSHRDKERDLKDRFSPQAAIYVGKWFSPVAGARLGVTWLQTKGLADGKEGCVYLDNPVHGKYYKQRFQSVGPAFDFLLNLTNWWCGYKPGRVYNATLYAGVSALWNYGPKYDAAGKRDGWANTHDRVLAARLGLINSFRLSDRFSLFLDLRWEPMDNFHGDEGWAMSRRIMHDVQANLGFTVDLGKSTWNAPIVAVCAEAENCDALRARLEAADARIADLEAQLRNCLNTPKQVIEEKAGPLATIYYPINVSKLTRKDINVLGAIANVMKENPTKTYTLTGWADNFTGTEPINIRLRKARVAGVEKQLLKFGVPAGQITATTDNGNLYGPDSKFMALDRAVTIDEN